MILLPTILFFILGLVIGSFLNVVIYRLNTSKSLGGRSACMSCRNKLSWYELIPVFSFMGLMGRCRSCKTKISIQYPLVELATGFMFAALFLKLSDHGAFMITYLYYATAFSLLLVIAVYDLKHKIIPDMLSLALGVMAFVGLFFFQNSIFYPHTPSLAEFLSGIWMALPFALLWLVSLGRWIGLGDAKLMLGIGWLLGTSLALSGVTVAFWVGAVVGVTLVVLSRSKKISGLGLSRGLKSEIPFAPFLVMGAFLAFICEFNFFLIQF